MSRLLDHVKPPIITERELDTIRAHFITGQIRQKGYSFMNTTVAGIIARLEVTEENNKVLQQTLDDVKKQLDAARKEL